MLTSETVKVGQVAAPGYGSKNAADKTGPAPLAPQLAPRKGHHGPALVPFERLRIRACGPPGPRAPPWIGPDRSRAHPLTSPSPYEPGHIGGASADDRHAG
jgi:hypothetical protein